MNNPIASGALVLFVLGIILLLIVEGIQRQRRLDRMVFKPPVSVVQMQNKPGGYVVQVTLGFGLPEHSEATKFVSLDLAFRWDEGKNRYFFVMGQIGTLLGAIKSHGIGRKWTATREGEFWSRVEDDVAVSLLQHEQSMDSFAEHGVQS